jgi:hypothetical protein
VRVIQKKIGVSGCTASCYLTAVADPTFCEHRNFSFQEGSNFATTCVTIIKILLNEE